MTAAKKTRKPGRPKLPKGEGKGKIVPVRFSPEERRHVEASARASKQTVSEWTRRMLMDFRAQMTEDDWKKVMSLFGAARDGYARLGESQLASDCDEAIGLVHQIALDPRLS